jgi:valyl-tRNA synthetase
MLNKTYDPAAFEGRIYEAWEASGAFAADPNADAPPFAIMIPPPNVTGSLHMGHALTFTIQDALIRWRRMQGRDALWQPGTDHAGIATQMVVERLLATEGHNAGRRGMGREAFVARVWRWKEESGGTITRQLRRLGASLDWPRERFTMDAGLSAAVREVFVTLYEQGLIYRDRRLVNWDPALQTAISDLEVESREVQGSLWYIRYPIEREPGRFITVATTRPETMLGDVAVAVHPEDARYRDLLGRHAFLPLVGRRIPIIADAYSDPEKGTGAVKITPAHDFNDFAVGQRHGLAMPSILDREGRVTLAEIEDVLAPVPGAGAPEFVRGLADQDRFVARKAIVAALEERGLLEKVEPNRHAVPHGDRSGVPIEPLLTTQWYCNAAELAKPAIAAVEQGDTVFVPKQWENTYFAWMRAIEPWCISRQLWWGHRIPAWYGPDSTVFVARDEAEAKLAALKHYGMEMTLEQDEDVLDTWFSSALWPFSTLGWPERTPELARYYPGDVLVTGFDIIFFWVARMMMMGLHFMRAVPFRTVYIHGLVRDERGQKMSKSKGNIVDPLQLIERYGADALRFTICALTGPGRDVKLGPKRVKDHRSFVTKLWNAARFCDLHGISPRADFDPASARLPLARWILDAANAAVAEATTALEAYRFDEYAASVYRFTWNVFCDWFLELAKPVLEGSRGEGPLPHAGEGDIAEPSRPRGRRGQGEGELANRDHESAEAAELRGTAAFVLGVVLRLLHPAIPFVTEELWDYFEYGGKFSLIRAPWPEAVPVHEADAARVELGWVVRLVSEVRTVRAEMRVPPSVEVPILLKDAGQETMARAARWLDQIRRLARASELRALAGVVPAGSAQALMDEAVVVLPLAGVIDVAAERARLIRERDRAAAEAEKIERKLANADFIARAPDEVVQENRERLAAAHAEVARLEAAVGRPARTLNQ